MSRDFRGPSTLTDLRICVSGVLLATESLDNDVTNAEFRFRRLCHAETDFLN